MALTINCGQCGIEFEAQRKTRKFCSSTCQERSRPKRKTYDKNKQESVWLRKYGVTYTFAQEVLEFQGQVCAICGSPDPGSKAGWQTDHNHETGVFRGMLCHPCNLWVGFYEKNKERLQATDAYLAFTPRERYDAHRRAGDSQQLNN